MTKVILEVQFVATWTMAHRILPWQPSSGGPVDYMNSLAG